MEKKISVVCCQIDRLLHTEKNRQITIAIDGMCASGKSTLGAFLAKKYNCNLFHMDDFFLRPSQRTPKRLNEVGGNVDYERFLEEILSHLSDKEGFSYQRYNCKEQALTKPLPVSYKKLNIIEGAYSQHPYFQDIYDLRFFLEIDPKEQIKRICIRDGEEKLKRFLSEWIPMENRYFSAYHIRENSICL